MKKSVDDILYERDTIRNDLKRAESNKNAFESFSHANSHLPLILSIHLRINFDINKLLTIFAMGYWLLVMRI